MKNRAFIFIAALLVRAILIHHFYSPDKLWAEPAVIAKALVLHHRFGDVYGRPEPTAWLAPGYPAVVAVVFWIFGIYSAASAKVLLTLNALCSAWTAVLTYDLGKKLLSGTAGLFAGWGWALSGYIAVVSLLLWETTISGLLLTAAILLTLTRQNSRRLAIWAVSAYYGVSRHCSIRLCLLRLQLWSFISAFAPGCR